MRDRMNRVAVLPGEIPAVWIDPERDTVITVSLDASAATVARRLRALMPT